MHPLRRSAAWIPLAAIVVLVAACGGAQRGASASPSAAAASGASPQEPVATGLPSPTSDASGSASPPAAAPVEAVAFEVLAEGLRSPLGIAHTADGSGALYVVEQGGTVRRVEPPSDGESSWRADSAAFLDISDRVTAGGEQGLLGFAFHPDYGENRRVFAHYTDLAGDTVLAEYATADDGSAVDAASERVLLQVDQPYPNHNGGMLAFGPDGYLYLALGDGGSGGDPHGHGQDTETLLGSVLRLDVDADPEGEAAYAIPSDNPFASDGGAPEIWAYGLRNPWRFSFDRETGDLYIADVGQNAWEEINRQPANSQGGENYGWNVLEASHCFVTPDCDVSGLTAPVAEYSHDDGGCTVIGGYVYRGSAYPGLAGTYLFADFCSGRVWGLAAETGAEPRVLAETDLAISAFGEDEAGELYAVDLMSGTLYRTIPAD